MPLSDIQRLILQKLAQNRDPGSFLAGATVLHRSRKSPRYSQDIDFFQDVADRVAECAEIDAATLKEDGMEVEWLLRTPAFHRALVEFKGQKLRIEWAHDSAFRFFPIQKDEVCGYRLHEIDAAVNKVLALAGRSEARDYVDTIYLHHNLLTLGSLIWAACGKDPGYTPELLLSQCQRHSRYTQADLDRLQLATPLDVTALKQEWLKAVEEAKEHLAALPLEDLGCLYLDADGRVITPNPAAEEFTSFTRHWGSVGGVWPTIERVE